MKKIYSTSMSVQCHPGESRDLISANLIKDSGFRRKDISLYRIYITLIILLIATIPAFAQETPSSNEIASQMRSQLDLSEEQMTNIIPVLDKYAYVYADLEKSIHDGTINPSAIDSQRQGIAAQETQELSQYLKPYQLSQWRGMQAQMHPQALAGSEGEGTGAEQYSNLPHGPVVE
jgi:hypothetical protein